jgi:hypothetical protein
MIPEYIKEWYQLHKHGSENAFAPASTRDDKRQNLKDYLLHKFPDEDKLIEDKISEIADNIGYDDDDFMFGGRRRYASRKLRKIHKKKKSRRLMSIR